MTKRDFLKGGLGAGVALASSWRAFAQSGAKPKVRRARTKKLFRSPEGFPNALAATAEGLWIGEQKLSGAIAKQYQMDDPKSLVEDAWLVDGNGKVLKTVHTPSRNTSGMAVGGGYVWMVANAPPEGVFQVDMDSRLVSHRQIPLGPAGDGGGCHGAMWQDGKLWIASLRLRGNLRVDPKTWTPEFMIPFYQGSDRVRYHDIAWDNGSIWQVVGNDCTGYKDYRPALVRYDAANGKVVEVVEFAEGSSDPHGLTMWNGRLVSCDAGIHPGWKNLDSPTAGWVFEVELG